MTFSRFIATVVWFATIGACGSGGNLPLDPCDGVDCSGHGDCAVIHGAAQCACDEDYVPEGLACVPVVTDGDADGDVDNETAPDGDADADEETSPDGDADADADEEAETDADPDGDADLPICGDGECNGEETACDCADDCDDVCGDDCCTHDEDACSCESDCVVSCGDGCCSSDESPESCAEDCPAVCGDGACTHEEDEDSCADDCGCSRIFYEDFDDGDLEGWVEGSLSGHVPPWYIAPVVEDGFYHSVGDGGARTGGHHTELPAAFEGIPFTVRARVRGAMTANQTSFGIYADNERVVYNPELSAAAGHGYRCMWYPALDQARVSLINEGSGDVHVATATVSGDDEWHTLSCSRLEDGSWEILLDGAPQELTENIPDTTFTSFRFVSTMLDSDVSHRALDDIEVFNCHLERCRRAFFDDFEDDDISDWEDHDLSYLHDTFRPLPAAVDGVYHHTSTDTGAGGHHQRLAEPIEGTAFLMRARIRGHTSPGETQFGVFANDEMERLPPNGVSGHGYSCGWYPGRNVVFIAVSDGGAGNRELVTAHADGDDGWHDIACIHNADGSWQIEFDGSPLELATHTADSRYGRFEFVTMNINSDSTHRAIDEIEVRDCNSERE